jgi:hypothetical protein
MKKLLALFFAGLSLIGYSQSFQLTNSEGISYTDEQLISITITENDLNSLGEFITEIFVKNLLDIPLDVRTYRTNISLIGGMNAYVCFGICDDPTGTMYAMNWLFMETEEETYALHLRPNGNTGLCIFQLDFMVPEEKTMTLYVEIDMQPLGVKEQNSEKVSLSAYPNPVVAGSNVNITYTLADKNNADKLVIRNILGATVMSIPLDPYEKSISIDTSPFVQGIYFYAIENKNQISIAKKLIVK